MQDQMLKLVKQFGEHTVDAFNRGDFEGAVGYLPQDFEWHLAPEAPEQRIVRGPKEIARFYEHMREAFPDYRSEEREYRVVHERTIIVHHRMSGTGYASGASIGTDIFQVMELGEDGLPVRLREFFRREQAEEAARLDD